MWLDMTNVLLQTVQARPLKRELSLFRALISFLSVFLTLSWSQQATFFQSCSIGLIAALWAAAMQFWNRQYLDWLSRSSWACSQTNKLASLTQSYGKKFLSSSLYALLLYLGMLTNGLLFWQGFLPALGRIFATSAESLFTQTAWQRNNHDWKEEALGRSPEKIVFIENLSGLWSLIQSAIAVMVNVLNVSGSWVGDMITVAVGLSGILFFFYKRYHREIVRDSYLAAS